MLVHNITYIMWFKSSAVEGIVLSKENLWYISGMTCFAAKCQTALGMQTGDILDSALSASSSMDPGSTGPENAR